MATMTMQQKRGTLAQWTEKDPVLKAGEIGIITDKNKIVVGDGTKKFSNLKTINVDVQQIDGLLDATGEKILASLIPSLALNDIEVVADDTARFALTTANVQKGDVVIVTSTNKTYFVVDDAKLGSDEGYAQILTPAAPVQSVNNKTGAVTLGTDDIAEGENNLYFTAERAKDAAKTLSVSDLANSNTILHSDDDIEFDSGEL